MSIYKNKFGAEKELFACFQKEILASRNPIVVKAAIIAPAEVPPAAELPEVPLV
jgi:hypothetical protein